MIFECPLVFANFFPCKHMINGKHGTIIIIFDLADTKQYVSPPFFKKIYLDRCGEFSTKDSDCINRMNQCDQEGNCCNFNGVCDAIYGFIEDDLKKCVLCHLMGEACDTVEQIAKFCGGENIYRCPCDCHPLGGKSTFHRINGVNLASGNCSVLSGINADSLRSIIDNNPIKTEERGNNFQLSYGYGGTIFDKHSNSISSYVELFESQLLIPLKGSYQVKMISLFLSLLLPPIINLKLKKILCIYIYFC